MKKTTIILLIIGSILIIGCTPQQTYIINQQETTTTYSFLNDIVTCIDYENHNISEELCNSTWQPIGYQINENNNNSWTLTCCQFKNNKCYIDTKENTTTELEKLCTYNISNPSEVYLTNVTGTYKALCTKNNITWIDNTITITNNNTICNGNPEDLHMYALTYNNTWNNVCCANI